MNSRISLGFLVFGLMTATIAVDFGLRSYAREAAAWRAMNAAGRGCAEDVLVWLDSLVEVREGDIGYMPTVEGDKFLPADDGEQLGTLILGGPPPTESGAMLQLVRAGAAAVPCLVAHLDDSRKTGLVISHPHRGFGGMFFADEYDYNRQTSRAPIAGLNDDDAWRFVDSLSDVGQEYVVTVGDLAYVALGQIVNRSFSAVRYQPTAIIIINSPLHSAQLRRAAMIEWGGLSPDQHMAALLRDICFPDDEYRKAGAIERLQYYYPQAAEEALLECSPGVAATN